MDIKIAPSILASEFANLETEIKTIDTAGCDWIHVDVMDGHFVPNISFGCCVLSAIRPHSKKIMDVHLMINPVVPYLDQFIKAGADRISIHIESDGVLESIEKITSAGLPVGIAISPDTPATALSPVLHLVDYIVIMTVYPGFGGQKFIAKQCDKIRTIKQMIDAQNKPIDIQVDGGITAETAPLAIDAGANILVAGTAVFGQDCYKTAMDSMRG